MKDLLGNIDSIAVGLLPWLFGLLAAVSATVALIHLHKGRSAPAIAASGFFFLCVLLGYLPHIESVKAFAVDVKMRKSLDRAEEVLARVKQLSAIAAKSNLYSIANLGRLGSGSSPEKQAVVNETLAQLKEAGLSRQEREEVARAWLNSVTIDLYYTARYALTQYSLDKPGASDAIQKINDIEKDLSPETLKLAADLPGLLDRNLARANRVIALEPNDEARFQKLRAKVVQLDSDVVDRLLYTDDLDRFLSKFDGANNLKVMRELFP